MEGLRVPRTVAIRWFMSPIMAGSGWELCASTCGASDEPCGACGARRERPKILAAPLPGREMAFQMFPTCGRGDVPP